MDEHDDDDITISPADLVKDAATLASGGSPANVVGRLVDWMLEALGFRPTAVFQRRWQSEREQMFLEVVQHVNEVRSRVQNPAMLPTIDETEARQIYDVVAAIYLVAQMTASSAKYKRLASAYEKTFDPTYLGDVRRRLFVDLVWRLDEPHMEVLGIIGRQAGEDRLFMYVLTERASLDGDLAAKVVGDLVAHGCIVGEETRPPVVAGPHYVLTSFGEDFLRFIGAEPEPRT